MKSLFRILTVFMFFAALPAKGQETDTTFHLITCGPGTETYSVYGHSALRVVTGSYDTVYNWGVFDFGTPNFAWKFAKGRLNYKLQQEPFRSFLRIYYHEQRYVISQQINLKPAEKKILMSLVRENLKPENVYYRYDFFYDDCSTRIRDLLEKATGGLTYPAEHLENIPTFREMTAKYQAPFPWLQFGVDMLMGSPGEKPANVRDRMFLPVDMMEGLSGTFISRDGSQTPLLQSPETILDFPVPTVVRHFYTSPFALFTILLLIVALLTFTVKGRIKQNTMDFVLFFAFAVLAGMMIFFNFFTDHEQMRMNYNILWLNPVLIVCFIAIVMNRKARLWFRILFYVSCIFLAVHLFLPQAFHPAMYPLLIIILLRSFMKSGFISNQQNSVPVILTKV